jgi:hypothetical protein
MSQLQISTATVNPNPQLVELNAQEDTQSFHRYTLLKEERDLHLDEAFLKEDLNHLLENWKQARMVDANTSLQ